MPESGPVGEKATAGQAAKTILISEIEAVRVIVRFDKSFNSEESTRVNPADLSIKSPGADFLDILVGCFGCKPLSVEWIAARSGAGPIPRLRFCALRRSSVKTNLR